MRDQASGMVGVRREERAGGIVAHVTIDNARKLNALNSAVMTEFVAAIEQVSADDGVQIGRAHV